jgi:hypothetical protein
LRCDECGERDAVLELRHLQLAALVVFELRRRNALRLQDASGDIIRELAFELKLRTGLVRLSAHRRR